MTRVLLSTEQVEALHVAVLNPGEWQGRARDKSLEATLARVDNRIAYGMIVTFSILPPMRLQLPLAIVSMMETNGQHSA